MQQGDYNITNSSRKKKGKENSTCMGLVCFPEIESLTARLASLRKHSDIWQSHLLIVGVLKSVINRNTIYICL